MWTPTGCRPLFQRRVPSAPPTLSMRRMERDPLAQAAPAFGLDFSWAALDSNLPEPPGGTRSGSPKCVGSSRRQNRAGRREVDDRCPGGAPSAHLPGRGPAETEPACPESSGSAVCPSAAAWHSGKHSGAWGRALGVGLTLIVPRTSTVRLGARCFLSYLWPLFSPL